MKNISNRVHVCCLTGRVQNDNYTNKNGERVYSVQIMADEIEFAERKSTADANASRGASILAVELRNRLWLQMTIS